MPIYEYKCNKCANIDEVLLRFGEQEPSFCSICGSPTHKIISQSSFALKGSGWYVTDYGRKDSGSSESASSKSKGSSSASASPSTTDTSSSQTSSAQTVSSPAASSTPASSSGATPAT